MKEIDPAILGHSDMPTPNLTLASMDKINFKSWDMQLDKHLSRAWSRDEDISTVTKQEEWGIDLAKLDIRQVIAHGTFGTVYHGIYDSQDVGGIGLGVDGIATAAETASLWASFRQEVVVWHKLDHQNVTKIGNEGREKEKERGEGSRIGEVGKIVRTRGEKSREQIADAEALLDDRV
ncbi:hypothetical protein REPUB_Repub11eG0070000 [Reevesia pubescens]